MITRTVLLIIIATFIDVHAQDAFLIDSLRSELNKSHADSSRSRLQAELARAYSKKDTLRSVNLLQQSQELAESSSYSYALALYSEVLGEIRLSGDHYQNAIQHFEKAKAHYLLAGHEIGIAEATVDQGNCYLFLSDYHKALANYREALDIFSKHQDDNGRARCLNNMGIIYKNFGDYAEAMNSYQRTIEIYQRNGDKASMVDAYINIGNVCVIQSSYDKALEYYNRAILITRETGEKDNMATLMLNCGVIYNSIDEYEKALDYYRESMRLSKELNDRINLSKVLTNIGTNYLSMGEFELAESFINQGLELKLELGDKRSISNCYNYLAEIQYHKGNYDQAVRLDRKSIKYKMEVGDREGLAHCYSGLSRSLLAQNNLAQALQYADSVLKIARELNLLDHLVSATNLKMKIFAGRGMYKEAFEMAGMYKSYNDSVMDINKTRALNEIEFQFQTRILEDENERLRLKSNLQDESMKRDHIMIYAILAISILLSALLVLVIYFQSRQRRLNTILQKKNQIITRQNLKLDKLHKTKSTILSIITHDLRGTIGNQVTALNLINEGGLPEGEERSKIFSKLAASANMSLELLEKLLLWTKIEEGLIQFSPVKGDLKNSINGVVEGLQKTAKEKDIELQCRIMETMECNFDVEIMESILVNLVTNAIRYSPVGGKVNIVYSYDDQQHRLGIRDRGAEISDDELRRFSHGTEIGLRRGTENKKGAGIGITIIKEFLAIHGGKLEISSSEERGTSFTIILPAKT